VTGSEAKRPLYDAIVALAASPDDVSGIDGMLVQVASLAVSLIDPVDYASITAQRDGAPTTVALSNQIALSIDEAQYDEQAGPCLDALDAGIPINTVIATTMVWPSFREAALELGVRASLSIPLCAGSGRPVAALNMYSRDADALAPLSAAMLTLFDSLNEQTAVFDGAGAASLPGDAGSKELLAGLAEASAIHHRIHVAIGVLMQREHLPADRAYVALREQAAATGKTLPVTATDVVAKTSAAE
jgi:hypothetical protein